MRDVKNDTEQKSNLDFMESLRREAEEKRVNSEIVKKEEVYPAEVVEKEEVYSAEVVEKEEVYSTKIVKKGVVNSHHEVEDEKFDYYYSSEEGSSHKRTLIGIFGIGIVGLMGYFGFDYLKDDKTTTPNSVMMATDKAKETNITASQEPKIEKKESVAIASIPDSTAKGTEEESKAKEIQPTKPSVHPEKEKEMIATIIQSMNHEKMLEKSSVKSDTPTEVVEKKVEEKKEVAPKEVIEEKIAQKEVEQKAVEKEVVKVEPKKEEKPKIAKVEKKVKKKKKIVKKVKKTKPLKARVVIVRKGDTLASISKKFYGNAMEFKRIVRANRNIRSSSSSLHLGQRIIVPRIKKERKQRKERKRRFVIIKKGDTLASISKRFYGDSRKFQKIINANYKIKSASSRLSLGQRVYVPR